MKQDSVVVLENFRGSRPIGSFEDLQEYLKGLGDRTSERDMYFTSETVKIAEIAE